MYSRAQPNVHCICNMTGNINALLSGLVAGTMALYEKDKSRLCFGVT